MAEPTRGRDTQKGISWREAIDEAIRIYRRDLDRLREYDLSGYRSRPPRRSR